MSEYVIEKLEKLGFKWNYKDEIFEKTYRSVNLNVEISTWNHKLMTFESISYVGGDTNFSPYKCSHNLINEPTISQIKVFDALLSDE